MTWGRRKTISRRELQQKVDELARRAERQHRRIADLEHDLGRVAPQVAAIEARLEDLYERGRGDGDLSEDEAMAAGSVLAEVRREHARVRARITAATVFEERLRVLEERVGVESLTGRDR